VARRKALPVAPRDYDQGNEQTMRRTVEQEILDLRLAEETADSKTKSLTHKRFQFLLMGA
jgi:hypothetical protein